MVIALGDIVTQPRVLLQQNEVKVSSQSCSGSRGSSGLELNPSHPLLPWAGAPGWVGAPGVDLGIIWVAKWLFGSGVGLNPCSGKAGVGAQCSLFICGLDWFVW